MKNNQTRLNPALAIRSVLTNLGIITTLAIPAIGSATTTKPMLLAQEAQQVQFAPESGVFRSQPAQPQAQGSQAPVSMQGQASTAGQNQPTAQVQEKPDASSGSETIQQKTVQPVANTAPTEVLSASDTLIFKEIVQRLQLKFPGPLILKINNGDVAIAGMAQDNPDATRIIANIIATPGVKNFNFSALTLASGYAPSRIAIAIGFTQGRMIRTKLFGADVRLIDQIPVKVTANNNIIYLDGGLYTLYTKTQSIIIAQRAVLQFSPQTRVISRLYLISRPATT